MPIVYYEFWAWAADMLLAGAATCALMTCGVGKEAQKPAQASPASPSAPIARPAGQPIAVNGDSRHQCYVTGTVNGASFTFLIDTGASDVSFGKNDARKLGYDPAELSFDHTYTSANGIGHEAWVTLPELRLGGVVVAREVEASIVNAEMSYAILGASALKTLHLQYSQGKCAPKGRTYDCT